MDLDFAKTLALLNGDTTETFMQNQLSQSDCAQIENAIDTIFSGLSLQKWLGGDTLTGAWAKAMDEIRDIVFAIQIQNSAVNYARNYVFVHRRKWHVKIVSCQQPNQLIGCPADKRPEWEKDAQMKIQMGMDLLHKKISDFATATVASVSHVPKFHNLTQMNLGMSREQEREHVRERTK